MHRSSESVAALASALAKAQAELVNPEKSLVATIRTGRPGDGERSFRYAPLSSGLDIVRKTLGQHEIATMQTTAVDQAGGLVNLITMLAHASGEWIASDWPVCPIAEMANPQRMGAALTYARRYALFTLVGIAGEDDLDAPDLCAAPPTSSARTGTGSGELLPPPRSDGNGRTRAAARPASTPFLSSDESAALRDRLLGEIAGLQSGESATNWAQGALAAKNQLTASDLLEESFEKRLSALLPSESAEVVNVLPAESGGHEICKIDEPNSDQGGIDKSVLTVAAPRRYRNRDHLRFVMTTEKLGRSAASGFEVGCAAAITRRPGEPRARRRFAQRSIYSRRGRNSMDRSVPSTSASPSTPATSTSISLMRSGALSTSDPMDGA